MEKAASFFTKRIKKNISGIPKMEITDGTLMPEHNLIKFC